MKFNKFLAPVMAGALSLTLGLAGCGSTSESTSTTTEETTETTTTETTTEETPATTEATTTDTAAAEDKILYWEGQSDKGDTLMYSEDEEKNTASVILFGQHDGQDEIIAFSGPATLEEATEGTVVGSKVTITDSSTGDTFSFEITGVTEEALTINLGEHGAGTLKPVTEKEFEDEVNTILDVAKAVGEQLETLDEQDVEELLTILGTLAELSDTTSNAQPTA